MRSTSSFIQVCAFVAVLLCAVSATSTHLQHRPESYARGLLSFIGQNEGKGRAFSCPSSMAYSPWIKACSCPPGQKWNANDKKCKGTQTTGAWPEPRPERFNSAAPADTLASFCAFSPARITPYDPAHDWCQVGVDTITFVALHDITTELEALAGRDADYGDPKMSSALRNVGAGLSGLYLEDVEDAVALFNTNKFGLGTLVGDILGDLPGGIIDIVDGITCLLKPRHEDHCDDDCDEDEEEDEEEEEEEDDDDDDCNHDCVAFATEGCGNLLDGLLGDIGDLLEGLTGNLCILDGVLELIGGDSDLIGIVIDDLLCTVGGVVEGLLSLFDCDCEEKKM